jgi:thymidylate synthase
MRLLATQGYKRESRYGDVMKIAGPVTTVYRNPMERVIFWPERDANPFFHLMESLWMVQGRNDVKFVAQFAKRMETFSDDGKTFHGAYGHRWRNWFKRDQVLEIIEILKANNADRRCVLQMWDATKDLNKQGKDVPCNVVAFFTIENGALNMGVMNRSNDMIWGAYGANAVHFSVLLEFMAAGIGVPVGAYWQMSWDYHAYLNTFEPLLGLIDKSADPYRTLPRSPYEAGETMITKVVDEPIKIWLEDLEMWFHDPNTVGLRSKFFRRVATPLFQAHAAYKQKDYDGANEILDQCLAGDWKTACKQWFERRAQARLAKHLKELDDEAAGASTDNGGE